MMRALIAWSCLAAAPASAGIRDVDLSLASDHAWSGLAGSDLVRPAPNVELEAAIPVMRWLSLDATLVWSRDAQEAAVGARLTSDVRFFVLRARPGGDLALSTGTALGAHLDLELGVTRGDATDVLVKAAFRY